LFLARGALFHYLYVNIMHLSFILYVKCTLSRQKTTEKLDSEPWCGNLIYAALENVIFCFLTRERNGKFDWGYKNEVIWRDSKHVCSFVLPRQCMTYQNKIMRILYIVAYYHHCGQFIRSIQAETIKKTWLPPWWFSILLKMWKNIRFIVTRDVVWKR